MQPSRLQTGTQPHIYVCLDDTLEHEHILKKFHCSVCGKVVFKYYGLTKILFPAENESTKKGNTVVVQCNGTITEDKNGYPITSRCKTLYWIS